MYDEITTKLIALISEHLDVAPEAVTPEASFFQDLGADSLDIVDIAMRIEEAFGIQIRNEDYLNLTRLGDAAKYIEKRRAEADAELLAAVGEA